MSQENGVGSGAALHVSDVEMKESDLSTDDHSVTDDMSEKLKESGNQVMIAEKKSEEQPHEMEVDDNHTCELTTHGEPAVDTKKDATTEDEAVKTAEKDISTHEIAQPPQIETHLDSSNEPSQTDTAADKPSEDGAKVVETNTPESRKHDESGEHSLNSTNQSDEIVSLQHVW